MLDSVLFCRFRFPITSLWSQLGHCLPALDAGDVRLRWLTEADVPALFAIFGDPQVTRYWGFDALPDLAAATALLGLRVPPSAELDERVHSAIHNFGLPTLRMFGLGSRP